MFAEERASGISPEKTELDETLETILERTEWAEEKLECGMENKKRMDEKDKETAENV